MVLDLDDTLYLERDYVKSGFDVVGKWAKDHLGVAGFAGRAYAYFEAGQRGNIFNVVLGDLHIHAHDQLLGSMVQVYREHWPVISLLPDACDFLKFCGDQKVALGLITDGPVESQRNKVKALGIEPYFKLLILTGCWPGWSKPNPHAFRRMEEEMGGHVDEFWYVADNPQKDFHAPLKLGWRTVRIRRPGGLHSHLESQPGCQPELELADLWTLRDSLVAHHSRGS